MDDDSSVTPRLLSGTAAAAYCSVTLNTWSKWVSAGLMPKPVIGRRWDKKAIDLALDRASGIESATAPREEDPLEKWMREDAARRGAAEFDEWERKYDARKANRSRRLKQSQAAQFERSNLAKAALDAALQELREKRKKRRP